MQLPLIRPFVVNCDVYIDNLGAVLEQDLSDCSVRATAYISRATFDSERNWTPLDLEAGSIEACYIRVRGDSFWPNYF